MLRLFCYAGRYKKHGREYMKATGTHKIFLSLFIIFTSVIGISLAHAMELISVDAERTDGGNN
jgi:hypothetical protein